MKVQLSIETVRTAIDSLGYSRETIRNYNYHGVAGEQARQSSMKLIEDALSELRAYRDSLKQLKRRNR